jgi:hypothetical protein
MMTTSRGARWLLLGLALGLFLAVAVGLYAARAPRAHVVDESIDATVRKSIEYEGVEIDIPADWERWDMGGCEFQFERWGPPGQSACASDATSVAFYDAATFDPAHGPGVRRIETAGTDSPDWAGYVDAGSSVVYARDEDRAVVQGILRSAR